MTEPRTPAPDRHQLTPSDIVQQLTNGHITTQLVYVAAKLEIADHLWNEPQHSSTLAQKLGVHERALHRVMRGLANIGVLSEGEDGRFGLTPVGECLRKDIPGSRHSWAVYAGELMYEAWRSVLHTVRTGETAFSHRFGSSLFEYLQHQPEQNDHFNRGMTSGTYEIAQAVVAAYDFTGLHTIVDVGGGHGTMLAAILQVNPHLNAILFDLEHVISGARHTFESAGVADRCRIVTGSFFDSIPAGADAYILSRIIHDWDDEQAIAILKQCRAALPSHGKLLLVEQVLPERITQPSPAVRLDLVMLVITGGMERTANDYRALFAAAGFEVSRIIPTGVPSCIIEGIPTA